MYVVCIWAWVLYTCVNMCACYECIYMHVAMLYLVYMYVPVVYSCMCMLAGCVCVCVFLYACMWRGLHCCVQIPALVLVVETSQALGAMLVCSRGGWVLMQPGMCQQVPGLCYQH